MSSKRDMTTVRKQSENNVGSHWKHLTYSDEFQLYLSVFLITKVLCLDGAIICDYVVKS